MSKCLKFGVLGKFQPGQSHSKYRINSKLQNLGYYLFSLESN